MKIKISLSNIEEKKYSNIEYNDILDEKINQIDCELSKLNSKNKIEIQNINISDNEVNLNNEKKLKDSQNFKQKIKKLL